MLPSSLNPDPDQNAIFFNPFYTWSWLLTIMKGVTNAMYMFTRLHWSGAGCKSCRYNPRLAYNVE